MIQNYVTHSVRHSLAVADPVMWLPGHSLLDKAIKEHQEGQVAPMTITETSASKRFIKKVPQHLWDASQLLTPAQLIKQATAASSLLCGSWQHRQHLRLRVLASHLWVLRLHLLTSLALGQQATGYREGVLTALANQSGMYTVAITQWPQEKGKYLSVKEGNRGEVGKFFTFLTFWHCSKI